MDQSEKDLGVITTLLERLEKERLPRALALREEVAGGAKLGDMDIEFLERVLGDAQLIKPYLERHPEYQPLAAKVLDLYREITELALKNEEGG